MNMSDQHIFNWSSQTPSRPFKMENEKQTNVADKTASSQRQMSGRVGAAVIGMRMGASQGYMTIFSCKVLR